MSFSFWKTFATTVKYHSTINQYVSISFWETLQICRKIFVNKFGRIIFFSEFCKVIF